MEGLDTIVADIAAEMAEHAARGKVADYIPDLAAVSPQHFGIAVVGRIEAAHGVGTLGVAAPEPRQPRPVHCRADCWPRRKHRRLDLQDTGAHMTPPGRQAQLR